MRPDPRLQLPGITLSRPGKWPGSNSGSRCSSSTGRISERRGDRRGKAVNEVLVECRGARRKVAILRMVRGLRIRLAITVDNRVITGRGPLIRARIRAPITVVSRLITERSGRVMRIQMQCRKGTLKTG